MECLNVNTMLRLFSKDVKFLSGYGILNNIVQLLTLTTTNTKNTNQNSLFLNIFNTNNSNNIFINDT